jgi:hypothetical protein
LLLRVVVVELFNKVVVVLVGDCVQVQHLA